MNLANRSRFDIGFTGFGEFATSVFTVYQVSKKIRITMISIWIPTFQLEIKIDMKANLSNN